MAETIVLAAIVSAAAAYIGWLGLRAVRGRVGRCACARRGTCPAAKLLEGVGRGDRPDASGPIARP